MSRSEVVGESRRIRDEIFLSAFPFAQGAAISFGIVEPYFGDTCRIRQDITTRRWIVRRSDFSAIGLLASDLEIRRSMLHFQRRLGLHMLRGDVADEAVTYASSSRLVRAVSIGVEYWVDQGLGREPSQALPHLRHHVELAELLAPEIARALGMERMIAHRTREQLLAAIQADANGTYPTKPRNRKKVIHKICT